MLYSELKERQSRFKLALKIAFPFLVFLTIFIIIFKVLDIKNNDFFLILFFIFVYIYYILYMIYIGFRVSLLDDYTKSFNSEGIIKEIKKAKNSKKSGFIAMLFVENITSIEEQYGVETTKRVLKELIKELDLYLSKKGLKDTPVGRYQSGNFILLFKGKKGKKEIEHILIGFCKNIEKSGILTIEIKMNHSLIDLLYDNSIKNLISKLINLPKEREDNLHILIKPDEFDILVKNAVLKQSFKIYYQNVYTFKQKKISFYSVNVKIEIENFGTITRNQITPSINKSGFEIDFDILAIKSILEEAKEILKKDTKIIIKISLVSFRNSGFLVKIKELLKEYDISAANICFSLNENRVYSDMARFKEIIKEYKGLGFYLLFDEFGLNNVGLEYIKEDLGFDMICFDLNFTKHIEKKSYFQLLRSFIELSKALEIKSLVKFVDKESLEKVLDDLDPDFVQGFLYDKPRLIKDI